MESSGKINGILTNLFEQDRLCLLYTSFIFLQISIYVMWNIRDHIPLNEKSNPPAMLGRME